MKTPPQMPTGSITTAKVLVGALIMGLVTITGVMFMLVQMGLYQPQSGMEVLLLVLAVLWPSTAGMSVVMKGMMTKQARAEWEEGGGGDPADLLPRFMSMTVLRAALLEGPGLFGAVAFLLTGNALALIAPALSIAALGLMFPSEDKFRAFVRDVTGGA